MHDCSGIWAKDIDIGNQNGSPGLWPREVWNEQPNSIIENRSPQGTIPNIGFPWKQHSQLFS